MPLANKPAIELETVYTNSTYCCFAYEDEMLVGAGRTLADGVDCSYICDVAVHPDFQNNGIGKSIVEKLVELSKGHNKIILYAYPGKEKFYEKMGFCKMKTAMAIFKNQNQAREWQLIE